MNPLYKKLLVASCLALILYACGGGGGGGGAVSGGSKVLVSALQGVSASTMTVGDTASASGSTQIVLIDRIIDFFKSRGNPFISTAYAAPLTNCSSSKQLIGSQDSRTWNVMGLTTATASASCVSKYQDAGNYLVLETVGVTDSSGNTCDLVVVKKSSGDTTCINLPLANRSTTGNPTFRLGNSQEQPGQLTANGNYFLVGFQTNSSNTVYMGFEQIDFTGSNPTGKIAYLEYGSQDSCWGVNGHMLFWSSIWLQENGNFTFDQFSPTQCTTNPFTGSSKYYYVDVNSTSDPLNPAKYLFDVHDVTSSDAYLIDTANSPLGQWLTSNLSLRNGASWAFGAETVPGGSTSATDLSFYAIVDGSDGLSKPSCSTGTGTSVYGVGAPIYGRTLIKVVITNGQVTFQDFGSTNIGSGYGANPVTDNVFLKPDGQTLVSVHWTDDGSGNMNVMKITRQLNANACDIYTKFAPTTVVPIPNSLTGEISTVGNGGFVAHSYPFTYRAKDYIYMFGFNANPGDPNCVATSGCSIGTDAQIWAYNKSTDAISVIPISQLTSSTSYYAVSTVSNPLSNKVSNTLVDGAGNKYWYSLGTNGIGKMIKFQSSFDISNGFISGTN